MWMCSKLQKAKMITHRIKGLFKSAVNFNIGNVVLIVLVIPFTCTETCYARNTVFRVNIQGDHLNLRLIPSTNSFVLEELENGRCVLAADDLRKNDKIKWVRLIHPKGWVSSEYLVKSQGCAELYEIVDKMYTIVKDQCEAQFYGKDEQQEKNGKQAKDFVASIMTDTVNLDAYCNDCNPCMGEKKKEDADVQYFALELMKPHCFNDTCNQAEGFCNYHKCDELPVECSNPYEQFLRNLNLNEMKYGYRMSTGRVDCCGHGEYLFTKIYGEWKIKSIDILCD